MLVTAHLAHWGLAMLELAPVVAVVVVTIVWKVRKRDPVAAGS
ncbi:MAG TPA: hypothetical protein VNT54_02445 [Solirubrobacteraceae bacterium]|nr:hypothetical protein [Solirubrobacteraceae bacterium]